MTIPCEVPAEIYVITGASSGIGRELALQLAGAGRELWLIGRDASRLQEVAEKVEKAGAVAKPCNLDLSDIDVCATWLEENLSLGVEVKEVYLAAAISMFGELKDTYSEDWESIYRINLLSPIQWSRHFYEGMVSRKRGRIVLISSLAAYSGYPTATAYATMKAGLLGLYRSLVHEGSGHGVSFHIACPGYVRTGIYRAATFRKTSYEDTLRQIDELGFGMIEPDEAARNILRAIRAGAKEHTFPFYATAMKWISPRFPFVVDMIHRRMMKRFRATRQSPK